MAAGELLEDSGRTVENAGVLYNAEIVEAVTCPDGSYKMRYQARGVKTDASDEREHCCLCCSRYRVCCLLLCTAATYSCLCAALLCYAHAAAGLHARCCRTPLLCEQLPRRTSLTHAPLPSPTAPPAAVENIETRFMEVFDSTYA